MARRPNPAPLAAAERPLREGRKAPISRGRLRRSPECRSRQRDTATRAGPGGAAGAAGICRASPPPGRPIRAVLRSLRRRRSDTSNNRVSGVIDAGGRPDRGDALVGSRGFPIAILSAPSAAFGGFFFFFCGRLFAGLSVPRCASPATLPWPARSWMRPSSRRADRGSARTRRRRSRPARCPRPGPTPGPRDMRKHLR